MEDRNPSAPRTGGTNRREGINPLYLVTSKSDNCDLSRFAEKCADNMNEASLRSSSEELSKTERPSKVYDGKVDKRQIYLSRTLKTPSTLSSCKTPKVRSTPAMNCTEMIVICVDISKDMGRLFSNSDAKEKCSFMQCVEKALKVFVSNKLNMSASHKFALMFLTNTALWMHDFTSDLHKLMSFVKDVPECNVEDAIDMNDVFEAMMMKYEDDLKLTLSTAAASSAVACSYRLLMIYGRSKCIPQMELQEQYSMFKSSDRFTADVLYLYTDESENDSYEKIFSSLGEFDFHGNSYIFAVNKYSEVFECFAQLLGHPFQRPFQQNCYHVLEE